MHCKFAASPMEWSVFLFSIPVAAWFLWKMRTPTPAPTWRVSWRILCPRIILTSFIPMKVPMTCPLISRWHSHEAVRTFRSVRVIYNWALGRVFFCGSTGWLLIPVNLFLPSLANETCNFHNFSSLFSLLYLSWLHANRGCNRRKKPSGLRTGEVSSQGWEKSGGTG